MHGLPPFVPKRVWAKLGNAIKRVENPSVPSIPGENWISLRCDGHGLSKLTKQYRKMGLFEDEGYSVNMATIMVNVVRTYLVENAVTPSRMN